MARPGPATRRCRDPGPARRRAWGRERQPLRSSTGPTRRCGRCSGGSSETTSCGQTAAGGPSRPFERARALELRTDAAAKRAEADARAAEQVEAAEERRAQARRDAEAERAEASRLQADRETAQATAAAARARDIEAARRNEQATIDKMTKRQRLEALEDKTEALSSESDAVVARDEAERLRNAATATKTARKNGD